MIRVNLTPHQEEKRIETLSEFRKGRRRIVLTGSAGVGKTTLVNFILEDFIKDPGTIYIAAPTHKALSVLSSKIQYEEGTKVKFCTVHKGLKLKMKVNNKTGKKDFTQVFKRNDEPFKRCSLLVVDEASMLSVFLLDLLAQYDFPILFIGDEKQVNPVKEMHSPVFHQNWYTIELTQIIRQGEGNPIIDLSRNLPMIWDKKENVVKKGDGLTGYLYTGDRQKIVHKLAKINGSDELKYLAWTNAEVDAINFSVRAYIYGTPALIEAGESLILNSSYVIDNNNILQNNEELFVESVEVIERQFWCGNNPFVYKVYAINNTTIFAIHEDFLPIHRNNIRAMKAMAINGVVTWVEYYSFSEQFLDFKYNHAITVHKSQGSTYKEVVINIADVKSNKKVEERTRLLYTAVTRASDLVVLYNV